MELDTMRALLAGFVSGAAAAFAHAAVVMLAVLRWMRTGRGIPLRGFERVSPGLIGAMFVNILLLFWTAAGLLLGAAYLKLSATHPEAAFGTPNRLFTLLVLGVLAVVIAVAAFIRRDWVRWPVLATAAIAALAFAWMLPNLAR